MTKTEMTKCSHIHMSCLYLPSLHPLHLPLTPPTPLPLTLPTPPPPHSTTPLTHLTLQSRHRPSCVAHSQLEGPCQPEGSSIIYTANITHARTHAHTHKGVLTGTKSLFFNMTTSPTSMLLHAAGWKLHTTMNNSNIVQQVTCHTEG